MMNDPFQNLETDQNMTDADLTGATFQNSIMSQPILRMRISEMLI